MGAVMRKTEEDKAGLKTRFPCPVPEYMHDHAIEQVANKYCGGMFDEAEKMLHWRPATFYRRLGWCRVDSAVEPIAMERSAERAKKPDPQRQKIGG